MHRFGLGASNFSDLAVRFVFKFPNHVPGNIKTTKKKLQKTNAKRPKKSETPIKNGKNSARERHTCASL
jgi:hypothetical protein